MSAHKPNPSLLLTPIVAVIPVLFCGILLILQFGPAAGGLLTIAMAITVIPYLLRNRAGIERIFRLLFLPLLGPAYVGGRPVDPGPVFVFLDIELDRRERGMALAACIASATAHAARLSGRMNEQSRAALYTGLGRDFEPTPDREWIAYILDRSASLLATLDPARCEASLDETIGLARRLAAGPRERESTALLFAYVYQTLLLCGNGQIDNDRFFQKICRKHGFSPRETSAARAAGIYYRHAFRNTAHGDERRRGAGQHGSRAGRTSRSRTERSPVFGVSPATLQHFRLKPDYDADDLERAWKRILHTYHPDRHHGRSPSEQRKAHERFLTMKRDYETLRRHLELATS